MAADNKKKDILQAAREEFLEQGLAGARTVSIAKKAGVTHAMLHYYFKTKEQLFNEVFEQEAQRLSDSITDSIEVTDKPFIDMICDLVGKHYDFVRENPLLIRFALMVVQDKKQRELFSVIMRPQLKEKMMLLNYRLQEAITRQEITPITIQSLLFTIISLNASAFLWQPMMMNIMDASITKTQMRAIYDARKEENIRIIRKLLSV